jgi:hypothetical protein
MDSKPRPTPWKNSWTKELDDAVEKQTRKLPTVAELDTQIETRTYRRGVGSLFARNNKVKRISDAGQAHLARFLPPAFRNREPRVAKRRARQKKRHA